MSTLKLFISHSSKTDASRKLLRSVCKSLQSNGKDWKVLVDSGGDIHAGEDWEKRLDEWLAECHAAVILINEAALKSWWVQKEATILKWRWSLKTIKHLIIVLLDDLTQDVFKMGRFKILNLERIQFLKDHDNDPQKIIASIKRELAEVKPANTSFDRMIGTVAGYLKEDREVLSQALRDLQVEQKLGETVKWSSIDCTPQAEAFARLILRENNACLRTYNDVIDAFNPSLHYDRAHPLYQMVYPLWVDEEAAALLPLSRLDENREGRRIAVNGNKVMQFTAESLVRRIYPFSKDWELITIKTTQTEAAAVADEVRDYFRHRIIYDLDASNEVTDEEINDYISPLYILLPDNLDDEFILDELQECYPKAVFLLSVGGVMPDVDAMPANARPISPPINIDLEKVQNQQMKRSRTILNKLPGSPPQ
jgi:hypothetical protein